ncbi:NAD(P)H:quinone oxidoreductase [Nocardia lijiangensis]|uniref:NAD(P)H:quinone oxidoreductase n=1 Tax=Nocardia lijiangensis TaxID=299618 RepID=UPI003D72DDF7
MSVNLTIVYYSATGTIAELAEEMARAAEHAGNDVRVRRVAELAPQAVVDAKPTWAAHAAATAHIPIATADDLLWADAVIMGSPTRFGNIAAQLKQFIDTLSGPWSQGLLADKIYSGFTSAGTAHGGHESTLLALTNSFIHLGGVIVPPGYTHPDKFADGNPYGTSHNTRNDSYGVDETARAAARVQVARVLRYAHATRAVAAA